MGRLLMLAPAPTAPVPVPSRGTGAANLLTPDPKEVWADTATGAVTIDLALGGVRSVDTVFLGSIVGAVAGATWSIAGSLAGVYVPMLPASQLRVPDAAGQFPNVSHALWNGAKVNIDYIQLTLNQPAGNPPLMVGNLLLGAAFVAQFGQEWGAGRKVIDTGTATALPSGGYAVVEGARKGAYSWTFGDLSAAEADALYALQLDRGETRPLVVAEDPALTTGLRWRLHYGKLASLRQYERRNPAQTRWELTIEEWI